MMAKYQEWSKVLIEPQSLNDARLFALETRVHEEEELRMREFQLLKDHIKKLVFTLEQKDENHLHSKQFLSQSLNVSMRSALDHRPDDMFAKRLEFLKSTLDDYVPESTTSKLRQASEDVKFKRIWELWKKDHETSQISTIVDGIKKKPFDFDEILETIQKEKKQYKKSPVTMRENSSVKTSQDQHPTQFKNKSIAHSK